MEFAQARYYNSSHGRFTSVDPLTASATIKNPQTFNRYSYALNSPYKFTDPLGLISSSTTACGICDPDSTGEPVGRNEGAGPVDDPIEEAGDRNVPVVWQEHIGTHDVTIAEGSMELDDKMVKTLGNDATEFNNLGEQISNSHSSTFFAITELGKEGFGSVVDHTEDGKMRVTLTNPEGESFSYGASGGGVSSGSGISRNSKITNVMNLVDAHNALVQKRADLYTQRKTAFQNDNHDATLKVTSFKWSLSEQVYKRSAEPPTTITVDRQFLGRLYEIRIKPIAKVK